LAGIRLAIADRLKPLMVSTGYCPLTKKNPLSGVLFKAGQKLLDGNFDAPYGFAGKTANLTGFVGNNTVALGVHGEVAAELGAFAGALRHAYLADNDLAGTNLLAAVHLNTKALARAVFDVLGCSACFNV